MNMKQKTNNRRLLAVAAVLLLLVVSLSACASGPAKNKLTLPPSVDPAEDGHLTGTNIRAIGEMLVAAYDDAAFDCRDYLIAASNGYDMLEDGFNDADLANMPKTEDDAGKVAIAVKILDRSGERVKETLRVDKSVYENMNYADLEKLISIFQTTVDTDRETGFMYTIQSAVGKCLSWITRYLGFNSYILGICIFAILVELVMLPFAVKQQKNSIRQAKLRPKEMAIRNKYKGRNDQVTMRKMQEEIQELHQKENVSPMAGCLPLLLQFPIIIILYNVVIDPLRYVLGQAPGISSALTSYYTAARAAGGLGETLQSARSTIELISNNGIAEFEGLANFRYFTNGGDILESLRGMGSIPNFTIFGQNFGLTPSMGRFDILLLVPVLTFAVYFLSMKLNRKFSYQPQTGADDRQTACSNTMMDVTMPLMSTFFTFMVPGIIGVYWMFRSVVGILKQFLMSKIMPLPTFTEEDYKAAAREMAGKAPKKAVKSERAGTVRSLHHIDDEDYDDTRDAALARRAKIEKLEQESDQGERKAGFFEAPTVKTDRKKKKETKNAGDGENTEELAQTGFSEKNEQVGPKTEEQTEEKNDQNDLNNE